MKNTPITDACIENLENVLNFTEQMKTGRTLFDYFKLFLECIKEYTEKINSYPKDVITQEFWALADDIAHPASFKKLYAMKFSRLLEMDLINPDVYSIDKLTEQLLKPVYLSCVDADVDLKSLKYIVSVPIFASYIQSIHQFRNKILSLLKEYDVLNSDDKLTEIYTRTSATMPIRIASKHKTDIIKILSAMYDARMFAGEDGKSLTNKQKLMDAFGEFLGDDFSTYSVSLTQAKNRDRKTFMKPFTEIENAAERYLEEE